MQLLLLNLPGCDHTVLITKSDIVEAIMMRYASLNLLRCSKAADAAVVVPYC
jgi:hypothetical protein